MSNKMTVFENEEFGRVRTVEVEGEPWFVGKDVARALGYKKSENAIAVHIEQEDKGVTETVTPGGKQKMTIINESGLYSLILSSKLPTAKKFKRWVTSEVLPAIRKNGAYAAPGVTADADRVFSSKVNRPMSIPPVHFFVFAFGRLILN